MSFVKNILTVTVLSIATAFALAVWVPLCAYADDASDLKELTEEFEKTEASIKALQDEYITAVRIESELSAQIEVLEAELADLERDIDKHNEIIAQLAVAEYKQPSAERLINILFDAQSLEDARRNFEYTTHIMDYESKIVAELDDLKSERELKSIEVAEKKRTLDEEKIHLSTLKGQLEKSNEELSPKIESLKNKLSSISADKSSTAQMENILSYLDSVTELTETQEAIVRSAYSTPYAGGNLCEAWAEQVYRNAGVPVPLLESALAGKEEYFVSDSTDHIPPGAWVYGSGVGYMGSLYGHVGIYVGNGLIMDNEGSRTKRAVPIDEWVSWQTASQNGKSGWYGWGYPGGLDFNPEL